MNTIPCRNCHAANDVTAIVCQRCGASLIDAGSDRWGAQYERETAREQVVEYRRERRKAPIVVLLGLLAVGVVGVAGYYAHEYVEGNFYLMGEPMYDHQPASYWVALLDSEDHFMRRRAALALDTLGDKINARTAREIVAKLDAAKTDEDETVRLRVNSALEKIQRETGVTP